MTRVAPSGKVYPVRHAAPVTFDTQQDAIAWLAAERRRHAEDPEGWIPPKSRIAAARNLLTFGEYAQQWLERRRVKGRPLADRTRAHYQLILDDHLVPAFGNVPLRYINSDQVDEWYGSTLVDKPTMRAHSYGLLHAIFVTATAPGGPLAGKPNPVGIRGAAQVDRASETRPASIPELTVIAAAMPARFRLAVLLSAFTGIRFGEMAELRRKDLSATLEQLRISRAVVRVKGRPIVKSTKSGRPRLVAVPPHLVPMIKDHLAAHVDNSPEALLFPADDRATQLHPTTLYRHFYRARAAAGRDDLRWHDLRHSAGVLATLAGASLADVMARLGHSTLGAAQRYMHAAQGRDAEIAATISKMAETN